MKNREGRGRKQLWPNQGTIPVFIWLDWEKPWISITNVLVTIQTGHLPNKSHTCHHYTKLLFFLNVLCAHWTANNIFKNILKDFQKWQSAVCEHLSQMDITLAKQSVWLKCMTVWLHTMQRGISDGRSLLPDMRVSSQWCWWRFKSSEIWQCVIS